MGHDETTCPTWKMAAGAAVGPGQVIARKYRVEQILGSGAMGLVVAARHLQLDQLVAIKLILPEIVGNPQVVQRFVREARAAARLRSEHVARVMDVGATDAGTPFIVMEHLRGRSLADMLAADGPLPVHVAVECVVQACDAIAEAHELGIVHRDLKPANLFLATTTRDRTLVKVLDFGISKTSSPAELSMTASHTFIGSPAYMSPEQMRSPRDVDGRADIWSLGVILWELVSGAPPFVAESFTALCLRIINEPLPPPPQLLGTPPGFVDILTRCLEKDPARRFQDVAELTAALGPYSDPTAARGILAPAARPRRRLLLAGAAVMFAAGVVAAAVVAAAALRAREERTPSAPPPGPAASPPPAPPPEPMPSPLPASTVLGGFAGGLASCLLPERTPPTMTTTTRPVRRAPRPKLPPPAPPARPRPDDPDAPAGE